MKVARRADSGKSGHLLISVPASRVAELKSALLSRSHYPAAARSFAVAVTFTFAHLFNTWYALYYVQLVGFHKLPQILLSPQEALLRSPLPIPLGTILCSMTH